MTRTRYTYSIHWRPECPLVQAQAGDTLLSLYIWSQAEPAAFAAGANGECLNPNEKARSSSVLQYLSDGNHQAGAVQ